MRPAERLSRVDVEVDGKRSEGAELGPEQEHPVHHQHRPTRQRHGDRRPLTACRLKLRCTAEERDEAGVAEGACVEAVAVVARRRELALPVPIGGSPPEVVDGSPNDPSGQRGREAIGQSRLAGGVGTSMPTSTQLRSRCEVGHGRRELSDQVHGPEAVTEWTHADGVRTGQGRQK